MQTAQWARYPASAVALDAGLYDLWYFSRGFPDGSGVSASYFRPGYSG